MTIASKRGFIADHSAFSQRTKGALVTPVIKETISQSDAVRLAIMKMRAGIIAVA